MSSAALWSSMMEVKKFFPEKCTNPPTHKILHCFRQLLDRGKLALDPCPSDRTIPWSKHQAAAHPCHVGSLDLLTELLLCVHDA